MFSESTINNFLKLFNVASVLKCFPFYWEKRNKRFRPLDPGKLRICYFSAWVHIFFGLFLEGVLCYNIRNLYLMDKLRIPGLISEVALTCSFLAHTCCNVASLVYGDDVYCRLAVQMGLNANWRNGLSLTEAEKKDGLEQVTLGLFVSPLLAAVFQTGLVSRTSSLRNALNLLPFDYYGLSVVHCIWIFYFYSFGNTKVVTFACIGISQIFSSGKWFQILRKQFESGNWSHSQFKPELFYRQLQILSATGDKAFAWLLGSITLPISLFIIFGAYSILNFHGSVSKSVSASLGIMGFYSLVAILVIFRVASVLVNECEKFLEILHLKSETLHHRLLIRSLRKIGTPIGNFFVVQRDTGIILLSVLFDSTISLLVAS